MVFILSILRLKLGCFSSIDRKNMQASWDDRYNSGQYRPPRVASSVEFVNISIIVTQNIKKLQSWKKGSKKSCRIQCAKNACNPASEMNLGGWAILFLQLDISMQEED
eukprot:Gregarina_sp_Poly_1__3491@NODE_2015_length_2857_cov_67_460932_g1302_i0_p3_GENE_NODE_2015_length_2857_cov_67_460932_g1302_i0NODE_2015_length_2857_cov_67_460932_g1302_i0_p3_ORF_typecomplete_len108_score15_67_NODE_2015_length_2857_cov_67_460932_g1302_i020522375